MNVWGLYHVNVRGINSTHNTTTQWGGESAAKAMKRIKEEEERERKLLVKKSFAMISQNYFRSL
jgi:hypothetical protein